MPRFKSADDAALWGEGDWQDIPAPRSSTEKRETRPSPNSDFASQPVLASLTQIQVLIETLCETRLDAMQQELVVFLAEAAVLMRCEILGESPPPPVVRPNVFDELDIEDVELIDDQGAQLETSPASQDYLDFEFDDELYEEPVVASALSASATGRDADFLDDLEVVDNFDVSEAFTTPPAIGPLARLRFLVADDNPAQQVASRQLLESLGADCHICNSATAAQLARMGGWEAILIDIHMHTREGIAAVREIRGDEASNYKSRTPLFVTAANLGPDQIRECLAAGADGHVTKPLLAAAVADQFAVLTLEQSLGSRR